MDLTRKVAVVCLHRTAMRKHIINMLLFLEYKVAVFCRNNLEILLTRAAHRNHQNLDYYIEDVSSPEGMGVALDSVLTYLGRVDVVVKTLDILEEETGPDIRHVNAFLMSVECVYKMGLRFGGNGGIVINITSITGNNFQLEAGTLIPTLDRLGNLTDALNSMFEDDGIVFGGICTRFVDIINRTEDTLMIPNLPRLQFDSAVMVALAVKEIITNPEEVSGSVLLVHDPEH